MDTRREFLKKAALLSAGAGLTVSLPESIAKAIAINPAIGTTYMDAEHVVILMQENRSFDHCYGTLQGVRGFNDPRAIRLPNKNLVWLQSTASGETYAPFRLNIKDTKATWMGSLPHSWTDQVDARNGGRYDKWLSAKKSGNKEYQQMPLTLGYYNREDIPFYYSLADAFTVCDQNFCSALTGTTPNRLYLWTGTIREKADVGAYANVRNENVDYGKPVNWKTFPERLEEHGTSWRIYQNELSVLGSFKGEQDAWLSNFTDNPIEWFTKYNVKFHEAYRRSLPNQISELTTQLALEQSKIKAGGDSNDQQRDKINALKEELRVAKEDAATYTAENYAKLSAHEKNIHEKAFTTNKNDPRYHELTPIKYTDGSIERELLIPAGDILFQFRNDVTTGRLPAVSWLVAPENFSDHPGAPWYGAWYVSEVLDILTKDPDIWKKTIFILAYDENDGYFDHIPPFSVPNPNVKHTGAMSSGIRADIEYVTLEQDKIRKADAYCRENSIGLGYRVPLVIASPWSRGGSVCSEIFDHTSILQFLEKFISEKSGKKVEESNISAWRRAICGDLTSSFMPYNGEPIKFPIVLSKNEFIEDVHKSQFKNEPDGFKVLSEAEIKNINNKMLSASMPRQENGIRTAPSLPYELHADAVLSRNKRSCEITFEADNKWFGGRAAGSPFNVYAPGDYRRTDVGFEAGNNWSYAVMAGDRITDTWELSDFEQEHYYLQVYGPNGFFREYKGNALDPEIEITCGYEQSKTNKLTGNVQFGIMNRGRAALSLQFTDESYGMHPVTKRISPNQTTAVVIPLIKSFRWYDVSISVEGYHAFLRKYSGRVENGEAGFTDPAMGNAIK